MLHKSITYRVSYRKIKYPRLEFKTGALYLILPFGRKPEEIIEKHINWITQKNDFITASLKNTSDLKLNERDIKALKGLVQKQAAVICNKLKVSISNINFRKMRSKWASCSSNKNITINTLMAYLPDNYIEYILYHEIIHLIEKKHNDRFWKIIQNKYPDYKNMEKALFTYWFLVNKKVSSI